MHGAWLINYISSLQLSITPNNDIILGQASHLHVKEVTVQVFAAVVHKLMLVYDVEEMNLYNTGSEVIYINSDLNGRLLP
jgi:hypothetical protein